MRGKLQTAGNIDLHLCPFINICDHNLATVRQVRAAKTHTRTHARAHCLSATTLSPRTLQLRFIDRWPDRARSAAAISELSLTATIAPAAARSLCCTACCAASGRVSCAVVELRTSALVAAFGYPCSLAATADTR